MTLFAYPWVLFALIVIPLLWLFERYLKKRPSLVVSSVRFFRRASGRVRYRPGLPFYLMLSALALLIVAIARPRSGDERVVIRAQGIDIILALDMSGSMRAYDIKADKHDSGEIVSAINSGEIKNRLDAAKSEIAAFIEKRPNDRIGLLGFSDLAYSFVPPTLDHQWLLTRLNTLEPGMIGDATGIASPIASAVSRLKDSDSPRRVLVLFTDGANTAVNRITPEQAAELAKEFNIIIHTVGIGSGNAYIPADTMMGRRLVRYRDQFDEKLLRTIAERTGGSYFCAADEQGLMEVMGKINELEKTSREQPRYIEYREYAPLLALLALVLLLIGFIAESTWKLRLP